LRKAKIHYPNKYDKKYFKPTGKPERERKIKQPDRPERAEKLQGELDTNCLIFEIQVAFIRLL